MAQAKQIASLPNRLAANMCYSNAAAAAATATVNLGAVVVTHGGVFTSVAANATTALSALTAADLPSEFANYLQPTNAAGFLTQPANTTVYYVIGVTAGGAVKTVQGTFDPLVQNATLDPQQIGATGGVLGGYGSGKSVIPDVPTAGFTPVAVMKIVAAGATFVPATTTTASVSTFRNVSVLPVGSTF